MPAKIHNSASVLNEATAHARRGAWREAYTAFRQAVAVNPMAFAAQCGLAAAALQIGAVDEALLASEMALALAPDSIDALINRVNALVRAGDSRGALPLAQRAAALAPTDRDVQRTLARTLERDNQLAAAITSYDQLLATRDDPVTRYNRGIARLTHGDLPGAWADYESRWETPAFASWKRRWPAAVPLWTGTPLAAGTLVLHAEQGAGDTIMFARFAEQAAALAPATRLLVPASLVSLLSGQCGAVEVVDRAAATAWDDAAAHSPLGSLPHRLHHGSDRRDNATGITGWLRVPTGAVTSLPPRPAGRAPRLGLAWAGNPAHPFDRLRSLPLPALQALLQLPGIEWVALQADARLDDLQQVVGGDAVHRPGPFPDFAATAAACAACDAIVTVDSAVAHLAGSLGVPTVTLLPWTPDWRWQLGTETTPWYPGMRLLRQPRPLDWMSVVAAVPSALGALLASHRIVS
ncbi:MAG: tetratricopeptide repeat protein [Gemmatimonadaceae bacterium]